LKSFALTVTSETCSEYYAVNYLSAEKRHEIPLNSSKKVWKYTLCLLCANEQIMQKCENQICFAKSGFWPKVPPK